MTRPISVSTAAYDGHPMEVAIAELAGLGVRRVEPAFIAGYVDFTENDFSARSAAALRNVMDARGVSAPGVSAHIDLGAPDAAEKLARRIGFAAGIGASILITNMTTRDREDIALGVIAGALPALEDAGLVLALENPGHGTDAAIAGAADFARLIGRIDAPHVRGNYDLGNVFTYSGGALTPGDDLECFQAKRASVRRPEARRNEDPEPRPEPIGTKRASAEALPHLASLHAKDVRAEGPHWRFVAIGDGDLGYAGLRRRLDRLAPDLPLALELPLRLLRPDRGDPVRAPEPVSLETIAEAVRRSLAVFA